MNSICLQPSGKLVIRVLPCLETLSLPIKAKRRKKRNKIEWTDLKKFSGRSFYIIRRLVDFACFIHLFFWPTLMSFVSGRNLKWGNCGDRLNKVKFLYAPKVKTLCVYNMYMCVLLARKEEDMKIRFTCSTHRGSLGPLVIMVRVQQDMWWWN